MRRLHDRHAGADTASRQWPALVPVCLTFDGDPDGFDPSVGQDNITERAPTWRGVEEGIPLILEAVEDLRDSLGRRPRVTLFVRGDFQISYYFGSSGAMFEQHRALWEAAQVAGHEIAWHPHLYREEKGRWKIENDPAGQCEQLGESFSEIKQVWGEISSVRIGEALGSNAIMHTLDDLRLRQDSTAMPSRVRRDQWRTLDWRNTPRIPYYPCRDDYRITCRDSLNILEIPMSMARIRAQYDRTPLIRYVDPTFHACAFRSGLAELFGCQLHYVLTVSHPSAILPRPHVKHGLICFDIKTFRVNLEALLDFTVRYHGGYRFVTLGELAEEMRQHRRVAGADTEMDGGTVTGEA